MAAVDRQQLAPFRSTPAVLAALGLVALVLANAPVVSAGFTILGVEHPGSHDDAASVFDGRHRPEAGCGGGCIYFFGGRGESGPSDQILRFNPDTQAFTVMTAKLAGKWVGIAAAWDGTKAWLFGGCTSTSQNMGVLSYDPVTDQLVSHPQNVQLCYAFATFQGGRAWIFPHEGEQAQRLYRYDPVADAFETITAPVPGAMFSRAPVVVGSDVYFFGGTGVNAYAETGVTKYSIANNALSSVASLYPGRFGSETLYDGSRYIYIFGGIGPSGTGTTWVDRFDTQTAQLVHLQDTLPAAAYGQTAFVTSAGILLFGNSYNYAAGKKIYVYNPGAPQPGDYSSPTTTTPTTTSPTTTSPTTYTTWSTTYTTTTGTSSTSRRSPTTSIISLTQTNIVTEVVVQSEVITQVVTATTDFTNNTLPTKEAPPPSILTNPVAVGIGGAAIVAPLGYLLLGALANRRRRRAAPPVAILHPADAPVLQLQDLRIERDDRLLDGVSFEVAAGELTVLLGPSGSGKSTLLKAIVGLVPAQGEIQIGGRWLRAGDEEARRAMGFVPQDLQLYTNLTVLDNLAYFGAQYGLNRRKATEVGLDLLAALGLEGVELRSLSRLSGGQQRRVSIAAAIVHHPRLLVLDEPTSGLDLSARKALWTVLQRLARERHVGILATTHFLDDCQYASRIGIIVEGRLVAMGTPRQLLRKVPGQGRCVEVELEDFGPAARKRLQALVPELKSAGLVDWMDIRLHGVRCFATDPARVVRILPEFLRRRGFRVRASRLDDVSLEDVFVHLSHPDSERMERRQG